MRLGVNINHVATIRQARRVSYPDIVEAAKAAIRGGADQITVHLREDRRHIQDQDVVRLKKEISVALNLEMAVTKEMVVFARKIKPDWVCLVPEKRQELTTEGGLNVVQMQKSLRETISELHQEGIRVSPFINSDIVSIDTCFEAGADAVEIHTGRYADSKNLEEQNKRLEEIVTASNWIKKNKMGCHAGHGLTLENVTPIAKLAPMEELNIGHSLVARALFVGLEAAVREMKEAILHARRTSI